ncbi:Imm43 family immunity protein [Algibacter lectus]|uniref:Imm43 family immunity protein n=1 Tax=Algibacter lectus TaxID=221126 RepID=UPI0026EA2E2D|nr:hypothetical protein [Algibacter lectus]MDO7135923.1 hypothetical protein [Algibacter lectus]
MSTYILKPNTELKGVPIFLDAVFVENFDSNEPMPNMSYDWIRKTQKGRSVPLPKELKLICKHKFLNFDYIPFSTGFLVSEKIFDIIDNIESVDFEYSKIEILDIKGANLSEKTFFYIDFPFSNQVDSINYDQSYFAWDLKELKYDKKRIEDLDQKDYSIYIKGFKELYLDESIFDLFQIKNSLFTQYLFCSNKFKENVENENIKSIIFQELPEILDLHESRLNYNVQYLKWNK